MTAAREQNWKEGKPSPTQGRAEDVVPGLEGDVGLVWRYPLTLARPWACEEEYRGQYRIV